MFSIKFQSPELGKSLYRGKVHYRLCSCQSTLSLAVGKKEIKVVFFKTTYKKLIDNCTYVSAPTPCIEISVPEQMVLNATCQ